MIAPELVYRGPWRAGGAVLSSCSVSLMDMYGKWGRELQVIMNREKVDIEDRKRGKKTVGILECD